MSAAITKYHAIEHCCQLNCLYIVIDVAVISETHLKKKHVNERFSIDVITCFAVRDLAVVAVELLFTPAMTCWPLNNGRFKFPRNRRLNCCGLRSAHVFQDHSRHG